MKLFDHYLGIRINKNEYELIKKVVRQHDFENVGHFVRCAIKRQLRELYPKEWKKIAKKGVRYSYES